jgi:hypothetical protein
MNSNKISVVGDIFKNIEKRTTSFRSQLCANGTTCRTSKEESNKCVTRLQSKTEMSQKNE